MWRHTGRVRVIIPLMALLWTFPLIAADRVRMSYGDAGFVLDALPDNLPPDLRGKTAGEIAGVWPGWVARRDAEVRNRLLRGEEDSVVNFWMFGTSFTSQPRSAEDDEVLRVRLEDLVDGAARPGANERLQLVRRVLLRNQLDPSSDFDRERIRRYLLAARHRLAAEFASYDRILASGGPADARSMQPQEATYATIFKDRGLSSDTSLLADFGVFKALESMKDRRLIREGGVRRVAVIGPGLDFTNKADGYDFYPPQTLQPFALLDTLMRLGLAASDLRVTTFDINPRVNEHLQSAGAAARGGRSYPITLTLDEGEAWTSDVRAFWKDLGSRIGTASNAAPPPAGAGSVSARTIAVRAGSVDSLTPIDLNIVFERLTQMPAAERFDLIVATNVLVYYDVFEQALALSNAAAMLRPGGFVVTNTAVFPTSPMKPEAGYLRVVYSPRQHDHLFWYQRQ